MSIEFNRENEAVDEHELESLLNDIANLLRDKRVLGEIQQICQVVSSEITCEEYLKYRQYKQSSLEELGQLNNSPGPNGILDGAMERGFILGYWFGMNRTPGD